MSSLISSSLSSLWVETDEADDMDDDAKDGDEYEKGGADDESRLLADP